MKKWMFFLLAAILLTACGQSNGKEQEAMYVNITAQEARTIMDAEQGYVILDTRTREEYDQGHIPGAAARSQPRPWWSWGIRISRNSAASSIGHMR